MKKLGIIAGKGQLPLLLIEACQQQRRPFFVLRLDGYAAPLPANVPHATVRLGAMGKALNLLRKNQVKQIVMIGAVRRPSIWEVRPDWRALCFLWKVGMRAGDDGLLKSIIKQIETEGFEVIGADQILTQHLAYKGVYGKVQPSKQAWQDVKKGFAVAKTLGKADVGQAVIVAGGLVLGVEAIEGTDALIRRCQELHRRGPKGVLVKVKKPQQERRADLPTIGVDTVKQAARCGLQGIAIEEGAAFVVRPQEVIKQADKLGVFVVGVNEQCLKNK